MSSNPKSFFKELSNKVLVTIVYQALLSLGILLGTWLVSFKISEALRLSPTQKWLMIISVCLVVLGLIMFFFYKRYSKYIPRFKPAITDFYVLEKEFTHEYLDFEKIRHTRRYKIKALRDGLDSYPDKYCWTGTRADFKATLDGHSVITTGYRNVFTLYRYQFGRSLKKGKIIDIEVEFMLYGPHKYFISAPIEELTERIILHVIFPSHWNMKKVMLDVAPISGSKNHSEEDEVDLAGGKYKWVIEKPKLMHHYEIKWNLNNIVQHA